MQHLGEVQRQARRLAGRLARAQRSGATHGALRSDAERGLTGLETAIVLTAFVVVASVLAYTVLSAGIFSTERSKEAIHEGLRQAQSSMRIIGKVRATALQATELDDADDVWTGGTGVTASLDTSDYQEGSASVAFTFVEEFTSGRIGYENTSSSITLTNYKTVRLWVKSSAALAAGQLTLRIHEYSNCIYAAESLDLPAISANTWKQVTLKLTFASSALSQVQCVELRANSDPGSATIKVDLVEAPAEVQQIQIPLASALSGEPVDLSLTTDTDNDGLLSDESARIHRLTVSYSDDDQYLTDLTWTITTLGKGDGDNLLEPSERVMLTVKLFGLNPLPTAYSRFSLTLQPHRAAPLLLQLRIPPVVDTSMILD